MEADVNRERSRLLVRFVPRTVARAAESGLVDVPGGHTFRCALLFSDVSGFVALMQKYTSAHDKLGVEMMNRHLNAYLGKQIDIILEHGGDLVSFHGDAIMALWRSEDDSSESLAAAVQRCCAAGVALQERAGHYDADDVRLRVRVAVAAGRCTDHFCGQQQFREEGDERPMTARGQTSKVKGQLFYLLSGEPVVAIGILSGLAKPGEVLTSPETVEAAGRVLILRPHTSGAFCVTGVRPPLLPYPRSLPNTPTAPSPPPSIQSLSPMFAEQVAHFLPQVVRDRLDEFAAAAHGEARGPDRGLGAAWLAEYRFVSVIFVRLLGMELLFTSSSPLEGVGSPATSPAADGRPPSFSITASAATPKSPPSDLDDSRGGAFLRFITGRRKPPPAAPPPGDTGSLRTIPHDALGGAASPPAFAANWTADNLLRRRAASMSIDAASLSPPSPGGALARAGSGTATLAPPFESRDASARSLGPSASPFGVDSPRRSASMVHASPRRVEAREQSVSEADVESPTRTVPGSPSRGPTSIVRRLFSKAFRTTSGASVMSVGTDAGGAEAGANSGSSKRSRARRGTEDGGAAGAEDGGGPRVAAPSVRAPSPAPAQEGQRRREERERERVERQQREAAKVRELLQAAGAPAGTSGLDPAEVRERGRSLLHKGICAMQGVIYKYDGFVRQVTFEDKGCCMIAAFGVPPAHGPDDAYRATLAAVGIRGALADLGVQASIAVTTGFAFMSVVGNEQRSDFSILGDVVNSCARLMMLAGDSPDVVCDARTQQAVGSRFDFESRGSVALKGVSAPVAIFRPLRMAQRRKGSVLAGPEAQQQPRPALALQLPEPNPFLEGPAPLPSASRPAAAAEPKPEGPTTLRFAEPAPEGNGEEKEEGKEGDEDSEGEAIPGPDEVMGRERELRLLLGHVEALASDPVLELFAPEPPGPPAEPGGLSSMMSVVGSPSMKQKGQRSASSPVSRPAPPRGPLPPLLALVPRSVSSSLADTEDGGGEHPPTAPPNEVPLPLIQAPLAIATVPATRPPLRGLPLNSLPEYEERPQSPQPEGGSAGTGARTMRGAVTFRQDVRGEGTSSAPGPAAAAAGGAGRRVRVARASSAAAPYGERPPPTHPFVVIVEGQAGVGKTCVVDRLVEMSRPLSVQVFLTEVYPSARSAAYNGWRELLEYALEDDDVRQRVYRWARLRTGKIKSGALSVNAASVSNGGSVRHAAAAAAAALAAASDADAEYEEGGAPGGLWEQLLLDALGEAHAAAATTAATSGAASEHTSFRERDRSVRSKVPLGELGARHGGSRSSEHMQSFKSRGATVRSLFLAILGEWAASGSPKLVVLEDCHLFDSGSMQLMEALLREFPPRLMLVLTTRPSRDFGQRLQKAAAAAFAFADPEGKGGSRERDNAAAERAVVSVRLGNLDREAGARLVAATLGVPASSVPATDELASFVFERTGGHPYFISQVTGSLVERGAVAVEGTEVVLIGDLRAVGLPDNVHSVIRSRIDRLTTVQQMILKVCSVAGTDVTFRMLERLLPASTRTEGASGEPLLLALDELVDLGLLATLALPGGSSGAGAVSHGAVSHPAVSHGAISRSHGTVAGTQASVSSATNVAAAAAAAIASTPGAETVPASSARPPFASRSVRFGTVKARKVTRTAKSRNASLHDSAFGADVGQRVYTFASATVQEVTYSGMSLELRTRLHRSVGFYLEGENARLAHAQRTAPAALQTGQGTTDAALAHHFARGGVSARALLYCLRALHAALKEALLAEAVALGEAASELVTRMPQFARLAVEKGAGHEPPAAVPRRSLWGRLCGGRRGASPPPPAHSAPPGTARGVELEEEAEGRPAPATSIRPEVRPVDPAHLRVAAADSLRCLGDAYRDRGEYGRAAAAYRRSVAVLGLEMPARGLARSLALAGELLAESWRLWRRRARTLAALVPPLQPAPPALNAPGPPEPEAPAPPEPAVVMVEGAPPRPSPSDLTSDRDNLASLSAMHSSPALGPHGSRAASVAAVRTLASGPPPPPQAPPPSLGEGTVACLALLGLAEASVLLADVPAASLAALKALNVHLRAPEEGRRPGEGPQNAADLPLAMAYAASVYAWAGLGRRSEEHAAFVEAAVEAGLAQRPARCALALASAYHARGLLARAAGAVERAEGDVESGAEGDATLVMGLRAYEAAATVTGLLASNCLESLLAGISEALLAAQARHGDTAAAAYVALPTRVALLLQRGAAEEAQAALDAAIAAYPPVRRLYGLPEPRHRRPSLGDALGPGPAGPSRRASLEPAASARPPPPRRGSHDPRRGSASDEPLATARRPSRPDAAAGVAAAARDESDAVVLMLAGPAGRAALEVGDPERALQLVDAGLRLVEGRAGLPDLAPFFLRDLAHTALALAEAGAAGPAPAPQALVRRALAALAKAARAAAHGPAALALFRGRALLWRGRAGAAARVWRRGLRRAERRGSALDAALLRVCLASREAAGRRGAALEAACEALERAGLVAHAAWARRVQAGADPFGADAGGAPSENADSRGTPAHVQHA